MLVWIFNLVNSAFGPLGKGALEILLLLLSLLLLLLLLLLLRGFNLCDIHKKQGRSSSNSGYEIQKICGWNITRARTPLVRKYTDRIFESKGGTTSMKIVNYIERYSFC